MNLTGSMDFLKSCTTNVQQFRGVDAAQYAMLDLKHTSTVQTYAILADLRNRNILCTCSDDKLWIFGPALQTDEELVKFREHGCALLEQDTVGGQLSKNESSGIIEKYLDAVEMGVSYKLANDAQALQLGRRQWVFSLESSRALVDVPVVRLKVDFVEPGSIYFAVTFESQSLENWQPTLPNAGTPAVVAPSGLLAMLPDSPLPLGTATINANQECSTSTTNESWKLLVCQALSSEGIKISTDAVWRLVQVPAYGKQPFLWPAHLCICRNPPVGKTTLLQKEMSRNEAFAECQDPLAFAEQWANSAGEREAALVEADQQQAALVPQKSDDSALPFATPAAFEVDLATSPPFMHRPDLHATAGIYPTPPDGLVPGNSIQQSLTSESLAPTQTQPDHISLGNDLFRPSEDDAPIQSRDRGPSMASSVGMQPYHSQTDGLFDDVDRDFGGGEVRDDDFDFFDDPDEADTVPQSQDVVMEDKITDPGIIGQGELSTDAQISQSLAAIVKESSPVNTNTNPHETPPSHGIPTSGAAAEPMPRTVGDTLTHADTVAVDRVEEPLSPFGVKERLLPPPIPASMAHQKEGVQHERRYSSFEPLQFKVGLDIGARFRVDDIQLEQRTNLDTSASATTAPSRRRPSRQGHQGHSGGIKLNSTARIDSEDDDSLDSSSEASETHAPPFLPWQNRKRKRVASLDQAKDSDWATNNSASAANDVSDVCSAILLKKLLGSHGFASRCFTQPIDNAAMRDPEEHFPSLESLLEDSPRDLVMVAQLLCEQAVTSTTSIARDMDTISADFMDHSNRSRKSVTSVTRALLDVIPSLKPCELSALALPKDVPLKSMSNAPKGHPRQPQRSDSSSAGPDIFPIAAPFMRFRRAETDVEMLPPAIQFWEALSLGPSNGSKHVDAFCVLPGRESLRERTEGFLEDLKTAYEGSKLGSFECSNEVVPMSPVSHVARVWGVDVNEGSTLADSLQAYKDACSSLGEALAEIARVRPTHTFVVFLADNIWSLGARQHLCACFWSAYKAYSSKVKTMGRSSRASDLVLQILPIEMLAPPGRLTIPKSGEMATFAREIYDRCPPPEGLEYASPLSIATAPSVDLASPLPRRIGFQLTSETPADLLHESSVLHLAFTRSPDTQWITACWIDNTARYQHSASFCLRGLSYAKVIAEIWAQTLGITAARQVSWRVFIATNEKIQNSEAQRWRTVIGAQRPKYHQCHVTLVHVNQKPQLALYPPSTLDNTGSINGSGGNFLTPVSTPQATTVTVSPDASGHINAPPTPAPSDMVTESDPDAHLVDITDETYGILLEERSCLALQSPTPGHVSVHAHGALIKRGNSFDSTERNVPVLGVDAVWTIRVRPNGAAVDEAPTRHVELALRELLGMYRSLGLLTKVRGVQQPGEEGMPIHLVNAIHGAGSLIGALEQAPE